VKILLLEDHPIFRFGVRQLVAQRWPEAEIVEADSLAGALPHLRPAPPAVAVVDLNLTDTEGLESISQLRRVAPGLRILVLSLNAEAAYATHALQLGVAGYLNKERAADELIAALERIVAGGRYITASLAERLADQISGTGSRAPHEELSAQEYRVMLLLAEGRRLTDIGEAMHLSPKTVTTYRARILDKLGVDSNAELIRYCIAHGIGSERA
jgi:DNA-binding NarL/FixJ family response regulator